MMEKVACKPVLLLLLISCLPLRAQEQPAWDDTIPAGWPGFCHKVEIISSLDGNPQPAYVSWADRDEPRPLVVSLHTWSGDYSQKDTLAWMCHKRGYHYIHPNFRGPNNRPEACGSQLVIQDLEDAIGYALENARVDTGRIHLIGTSGGGYAVLLAYMNTRFPVKTFSAWVPLSDIEKWYYQSAGRKDRYAGDILRCAGKATAKGGKPDSLDVEDARGRSPMYMETPTGLRMNSKLLLFAGIHDGYTGSVPVTQSLEFYNKVARDFGPPTGEEAEALVSQDDMIQLLASRNYVAGYKRSLGGRTVHYERRYDDLVRVVIFEGSHEMLPQLVLDPLRSERILVIGDSNGAAEDGWVEQLKTIRFQDRILNTSVPGNTIGFDNLGTSGLNTLKNAGRYLAMAADSLGGADEIVIMLGTNDCKKIFRDSLESVPGNLEKLIGEIKRSGLYKKDHPRILVVSPPPASGDEDLLEKYHGSSQRIAWLQPVFKKVAESEGCTFVDCYTALLPQWDQVTRDGIHLKAGGQLIIADMVDRALRMH